MNDGPSIPDEAGKLIEPSEIDEILTELLFICYQEDRNVFPVPVDLDTEEKLRDIYQSLRTFRRTSDTRALEKKINKLKIDIVSIWKALESVDGRWPGWSMRQHYAQLELLVGPFLHYTFAM